MIAFQDAPVSLYTGRASVNIPLGGISSGNLSESVSISYQTGGLPVNQVAECVGLGWSLNAGGSITRKVNGLPDEYQADDLDIKGFWHFQQEFDHLDLTNPTFDFNDPYATQNEFYDKLAYGCYDAEPDDFIFK